MSSTIAAIQYRRLIFMAVALLAVTNFAEGKMRLVPRGKKQNNTKMRRAQKKAKSAQIVLKPKERESSTLRLEATISENEKGEKVLLLSDESVAAVSSAMKSQASEEVSQKAQREEAPMKSKSTEQQVLFYDPAELQTAPGEIPVPKRVFDADGNEVDMDGKEAVLIPPPPEDNDHPSKDEEEPSPPKPKDGADEKKSKTSSQKPENSSSTSDSETLSPPQTQDQMIIISTVATMALLVGALSARRLRSRQFLSFCIENESLEDELAYDAAYTTQSTVGASSFYAGAGYDTFGGNKYGGDLRWRGDLEKFDV